MVTDDGSLLWRPIGDDQLESEGCRGLDGAVKVGWT